jgi:hypothetical protein
LKFHSATRGVSGLRYKFPTDFGQGILVTVDSLTNFISMEKALGYYDIYLSFLSKEFENFIPLTLSCQILPNLKFVKLAFPYIHSIN